MRPFRFAVHTTGASNVREWREKARRIEALGYSALHIPDHFGHQWGPLVALTVAAEATERLIVGTQVFANDFRNPVVLANEVATLDLVSEGRFEFGIGTGWALGDYTKLGITHDPAGVRVDRFIEAIRIVKQLWSDGVSSFHGKHYRLEEAPGFPRPATPGGPKVFIGGGGKRILSFAAREADIVGMIPRLTPGFVGEEVMSTANLADYMQRLEWIRAAAGGRLDRLEFHQYLFHTNITNDRAGAVDDIARNFGISAELASETPMFLLGSVDQIVDILHERREKAGLSYATVNEPQMEAFSEIVARLDGK